MPTPSLYSVSRLRWSYWGCRRLGFGFMADLISRPVLIGFISGVGVQLLIGKLPEMLGQHAHGSIVDKFLFVATHLAHIEWLTAGLAAAVVAVVVFGWKYNYPVP
ncbi:hypothetical protein IPG36_06850 [bacterium]|nr:MAG: hypothetical protein IPG36_06850 [bacterium]